jgi:hypothetical protein
MSTVPTHAIVIGGSIAGMLAARVLTTGLTQLAQIGLGAAAPHLDISYVAMLKR